MSETGPYATQGVPARNGYRLCEQDVNEQGGILGREIEFVIYDDESDAETAIALYERLIGEERVDAVMGPYGSTLTEAVAPVTEAHRQALPAYRIGALSSRFRRSLVLMCGLTLVTESAYAAAVELSPRRA